MYILSDCILVVCHRQDHLHMKFCDIFIETNCNNSKKSKSYKLCFIRNCAAVFQVLWSKIVWQSSPEIPKYHIRITYLFSLLATCSRIFHSCDGGQHYKNHSYGWKKPGRTKRKPTPIRSYLEDWRKILTVPSERVTFLLAQAINKDPCIGFFTYVCWWNRQFPFWSTLIL